VIIPSQHAEIALSILQIGTHSALRPSVTGGAPVALQLEHPQIEIHLTTQVGRSKQHLYLQPWER
jgi:hypothetical protein